MSKSLFSEEISDDATPEKSGSRLIQSVLTPAIRLWLSTQVDHAQNLQLSIHSRDRQILSGHIPGVQISADSICYQGLYLGRFDVEATNIRINWWDIAKGQPLRLQQPIPIRAVMHLSEADLNRSLKVDLFAHALSDLLAQGLQPLAEAKDMGEPPDTASTPPSISAMGLRPDGLLMTVTLNPSGPLHLLTRLELKDGRTLSFDQPQLLDHADAVQGRSLPHLQGFCIDLGETVDLAHLSLATGQLICQGTIWVQP